MSTRQQALRFIVVGVGATLLHIGIYKAINTIFSLDETQQFYLNLSYGIGYALSFVANYIASTRWTFKTQGSAKKGAGFVAAHAINFGLQYLLFNLFLLMKVGDWLVSLNEAILPHALLQLIPPLQNPVDLVPLPVFVFVVPLNFILVRFVLTKPEKK